MNDADRLGQLLATRRWCYVIPAEGFVDGHGFRVSIAIEYESGHYPTGSLAVLSEDKATRQEVYAAGGTKPWFWGMTYEAAKAACADANAKLGHSEKDVAMIVGSTMGGGGRRRGNRSDGTRRKAAKAARP